MRVVAVKSLARTSKRTAYRSAVALALLTAALLAWLALGVGIIGADGDPANALYAGVLAVAAIGAAIARLQPRGMARALLTTAGAQALVAVIALVTGLGRPYSPPPELAALNGVFIALFAASALLFRAAIRP